MPWEIIVLVPHTFIHTIYKHMITFLITIVTILFGTWIVYNISKRVEIDHQREWQEFLVLHPELAKKNNPVTASVSSNNTMTDEASNIKYVDEMWKRHRVKGDKSIETNPK